MTTTGTQTFNPSLGDLSFYALARCGVKRTAVESDHLVDVAMAANLVLSDLSTDQPNLWKVELISTPLVQGTIQYTMPPNVLIALNAFWRITNSAGFQNDRVMYPVGREEYDAYPNKLLQQPPSVYWVQRTEPIVLNIYPAPDAHGPYTLYVHAIQRDDDAALGASAGLTLPFRFFKAFSDGLAAELSLTYAPERARDLDMVYQASKKRAQAQDREVVPLFITPGLSRYYGR